MHRDYSVLQGFRPSSGQPGVLASELRNLGIDAKNVIVGPNAFEYPADFHVEHSSDVSSFLSNHARRFDIVHIHAFTPFFTQEKLSFPMGTDLLALKAAGKRIIIHFRGNEVRLPSIFSEKSPYNYVLDNPDGVYTRMPERFQVDYISMCLALADDIAVSDPELQNYVPTAKVIPRAVNLEQFHPSPSENDRPLVVHAPCSRGIKGTSHVLAAVEDLRREGLIFDFELAEFLPHATAVKLYQKSDIIVDQLRTGWYGALAVEGMALRKTVVSYIRDDLAKHFGEKMPLANANPDTIKSVLRELIQNSQRRADIASRGLRYCRRVHNSVAVAGMAAKMYEEVLSKPPRFDFASYMSLNRIQTNWLTHTL